MKRKRNTNIHTTIQHHKKIMRRMKPQTLAEFIETTIAFIIINNIIDEIGIIVNWEWWHFT